MAGIGQYTDQINPCQYMTYMARSQTEAPLRSRTL